MEKRGAGRPKGGQLPESVQDVFWANLRLGVSLTAAARAAGVSRSTGGVWLAEAGGVRPRVVNPVLEAAVRPGVGPLTFVDRCRVEDLLDVGYVPARIAGLLDRPRSTITREIARGRAGSSGRYRAVIGQGRVDENRRRTQEKKLVPQTRLFEEVLQRLRKRHSPEQIANRLREDFPDDPEMWVSHETIYQALFVQARGELREEVKAALRSGRVRRKPRGRTAADGRGKLRDMINISERPAEAADRAIPGHWEGDLIIGAGGLSAIGTLVERSTRFVVLLHLPGDHTAATVAAAITTKIPEIPEILHRSLTWDQGKEMALHTKITEATGLPIYFCDPHSPWQRGSNENTNGLLRQYFPKGTDLSFYGPGLLDNVAAELNARPRKTLDWKTPAEKLEQLLSEPTETVASTA
jgi:IS30 family transposase